MRDNEGFAAILQSAAAQGRDLAPVDRATNCSPRPAPRSGSAPSIRRAGLGLALGGALATAAGAQSLNHGAAELLFGEPVTTSATGRPQRASEVPVAMDIITAEQIRRSGARDIPEVLARFTSLDVQRFGAVDYSVGVRGYATPASPRVLVLVNGRQVYFDDLGETVWSAVPVQLAEIRQIEVVKGPNSALFGFNAAAGVINIVTYSPLHDRVNNGTLRLGSNGYREGAAVATVPIGQAGGVRLSAGLRGEDAWREGYTAVDLRAGGQDAPSRANFAVDSVFRLAAGVEAAFDVSYSNARSGELLTAGLIERVDRTVWSLRGGIAADTAYGLIEASLYRNTETLDLPAVGAGGEQSVTVLQLSDTVKLGSSHTLRPFLEYRYNEGSQPNRGIAFHVGAAGMMWNWAVGNRVETTAALRYDHLWLDESGYGLLPDAFPRAAYHTDWGTVAWNLGLVWRPDSIETVRLTAARGIGAPALSQFGPPGFVVVSRGIAIGNAPLLRPTVVDTYEIGYQRRLDAIEGRIGVSAFLQENRDLNSGQAVQVVGTVSGMPGSLPLVMPQNIGHSSAHGLEASASGELRHGFDWGLNYRLVVTDGDLLPVNLEYRRASPRHLLVGRLGWADGPWEADLFGRYASSMEGYRQTQTGYQLVRVEDHASLAGRLAYRFDNGMTLALEGSNVLQERQRQSIGLEAERQVFLSLRVDF